MGDTAIPSDAIGCPLRLGYDKAGQVRFSQSGRPVVRVVKEIADNVRMVRDNFAANLLSYAGQVAKENADGYKAQIVQAVKAGEVIATHDKAQLSHALQLRAEAEAEAQVEAVAKEEQAVAKAKGKTGMGLEPNIAGLLCYVLGWITGIIFLILEKENRFVRFHAMQSIVVFGVYTVAAIVLSFIPIIGWVIGWLLGVGSFILWVILMFKAYQGQKYKLPWAGNFAEKQLKPQAENKP